MGWEILPVLVKTVRVLLSVGPSSLHKSFVYSYVLVSLIDDRAVMAAVT